MYGALFAEMKKKSITQREIAKSLGISEFTIHRKMRGESEFTSSEMFTIKSRFFPEKTLEELFIK